MRNFGYFDAIQIGEKSIFCTGVHTELSHGDFTVDGVLGVLMAKDKVTETFEFVDGCGNCLTISGDAKLVKIILEKLKSE